MVSFSSFLNELGGVGGRGNSHMKGMRMIIQKWDK